MQTENDKDLLKDTVVTALEDLKGVDIVVIDVSHLTQVTDYMVVASGTSNRHVKALAGNVVDEARKIGVKPLGLEGTDQGEWALIDLNAVVVHVMQPKIRDFYEIERLWSMSAQSREAMQEEMQDGV